MTCYCVSVCECILHLLKSILGVLSLFFLTYASQGEVFKRTRLDCALSIPMKSDITMINTQQLLPSSTSPKAFNVSWP